MATELDLISLAQLQKLAQQQQQPGTWSWTAGRRPGMEDDDEWEVRAFAQDNGSATWPPRSYTCSFCRREFRSAQALGGHMNVHRRDRARLRQSTHGADPATSATSAHHVVFPSRELVAGGGLCVLYSIPSPSAVSTPAVETPAVLNLMPVKAGSMGRRGGDKRDFISVHGGRDGMVVDEVDLELRLGW